MPDSEISPRQRTLGLASISAGGGCTVAGDLCSFSVGDDCRRRGNETAARPAFPPESIEFFESRVRPILVDKCFKCHGEKKQSNGLRLDSRAAALKGGDSGPALIAGKPDDSLLIQAVAQTHAEFKMPPSGKLPDAAVATLRQWVAQGALRGPRSSGASSEPWEICHEGRA